MSQKRSRDEAPEHANPLTQAILLIGKLTKMIAQQQEIIEELQQDVKYLRGQMNWLFQHEQKIGKLEMDVRLLEQENKKSVLKFDT